MSENMMDKVIEFFQDDEADFEKTMRALSDEDQLEFLECFRLFLENMRDEHGLPPELEEYLNVQLPQAIAAAADVVEKQADYERAVEERDATKADFVEYLKTAHQSEEIAIYREAFDHLVLHPEMCQTDFNLETIKARIAQLELEIRNNEKRGALVEEFQARVERGDIKDPLGEFEELVQTLNPISTPDEQLADWKLLAEWLRDSRKSIPPANLAEFDESLSALEDQIEKAEKARYHELWTYADVLTSIIQFNKKMRELTEMQKIRPDPDNLSNN